MATTETDTSTTPETPEDAYDAMASAFDELLSPESSVNEPENKLTEKDEKKEPVAAETSVTEEVPKEETTEEAPKDEALKEESSEEPPKEEPVKEDVDWKAKYDELRQQKETPTTAETPPEKKETPAPKIYSADEEEAIAAYEKEWPDVVKGEALKRRAEYAQLVGHIFSEITKVYGPLIERGAAAADAVAETTALHAIQAVHADYDDAMYDAVLKWSDTLTGTRQKVAKNIIESGDTSEVIELITDFKSATGRSKPRIVAGETKTPATPVVTELSAKAKQAAKAMSVVDSKRTDPVQPADPNDFDAAWDEAVGSK